MKAREPDHPLIGPRAGIGPSVVIYSTRSPACPPWCDGSWHAAWGDFTWHSSAMLADSGDQACWILWLNQSSEGHRQPFITLDLTATDPGVHESAVVMLSAAAAATLGGQLLALAEQAQA